MTFRSDVSIDWSVSPRIITVLAPSTNITIQDLVDTCRVLEGLQIDLTYDHIVDAAGKQNLGGGVLVGITATLNNALLAFEARPGPSYIQCTVNGGNLVAVDALGAYQSTPISPTAFTQVILTSSSSATLQESADIEYGSFNGGVTVDSTSSFSGTVFPTGTPRQPVNNFADALSIANVRGFDTFYLPHGSMLLDASLDYTNHIFEGPGENVFYLTIPAGANVVNCSFREMMITGTLDGGAHIEQCAVGALQYVDGIIQRSLLIGPLTLGGDAILDNVDQDIDTGTPPIIDFNGTTAALTMRKYSGEVVLMNKTQAAGLVSLDLNSAVVTIDSSCTAGTFHIRGVGVVINNSTGTTVDVTGLVARRPDIISSLIALG